MSDEEKRSCFICKHQDLCHVRRCIHEAILTSPWMFEDTPRPWVEILDTLAEACNQYTKMKGAEK